LILCSFRHLSLSFGSKALFEDAELVIKKGDRIGLLGLNGKGKSSLFKILEGELGADQSIPPFTFDKNEKYSYFHVPQDMPTHIPTETTINDVFWFFYPEGKKVIDELDTVNMRLTEANSEADLKRQEYLLVQMEDHNLWNLQQSFLSYCKSLNLLDTEEQLENLSGGQKKKILLALGLSANKELILYDEPTNHLDIDTIRLFEQELLSSDKTFILTTHDRYLLGRTTNRIFQINQKKITSFEGNYTDFLEQQAQREKDRLLLLNRLKNSFRREDAWMKQGIKARGTRSKKRVENFNDIRSNIRAVKEGARRELELNIDQSKKKSKVILEAKSLGFSYPHKDPLFENLNFSIYRGNKVGLIGENGAGKTTLLKVLSGMLKGFEGDIKTSPDLKVCLFSQQRDELPLEKSPYELLGDGSDQVALADGKTKHVMSYFKSFLFDGDEIHRPLRTFSGGERNRLQLALNLKKSADIWIFDEPTNDLDLETLLILEKTLESFKGSVIIISHDRAFLKNTTNRLFVLEDGLLDVFEGGYEQAETYLEAMALERELDRQDPVQQTKASTTHKKEQAPEQTTKVNRFDRGDILKSIEEIEAFIGKIDNIMNDIGSLQASAETADKLAQLSLKKSEKEDELMKLYEKLEET
jgi:ATP-binding cassette subfamily F protein uup